MFGIRQLAKALHRMAEAIEMNSLSLNHLNITIREGTEKMSEVSEKLTAEIAKIAAKDFSGDTTKINQAVEAAVLPVRDRLDVVEKALVDLAVALNDDDGGPDVEEAREILTGVNV